MVKGKLKGKLKIFKKILSILNKISSFFTKILNVSLDNFRIL